IVLPGSMGVTEAGMIVGAAALDLPWTFHLISVEYDAATLLRRVSDLSNDLARHVNFAPREEMLSRVRIDATQLGAGYGIPTDASLRAASEFERYEALVLEQTYVAKTFAGLLSHVERGTIPREEAICILHTGGTPSIFEQS
ncbi:MAG: cysteine desulfhydrase, partial [Microvirga sp.]